MRSATARRRFRNDRPSSPSHSTKRKKKGKSGWDPLTYPGRSKHRNELRAFYREHPGASSLDGVRHTFRKLKKRYVGKPIAHAAAIQCRNQVIAEFKRNGNDAAVALFRDEHDHDNRIFIVYDSKAKHNGRTLAARSAKERAVAQRAKHVANALPVTYEDAFIMIVEREKAAGHLINIDACLAEANACAVTDDTASPLAIQRAYEVLHKIRTSAELTDAASALVTVAEAAQPRMPVEADESSLAVTEEMMHAGTTQMLLNSDVRIGLQIEFLQRAQTQIRGAVTNLEMANQCAEAVLVR